MTTITIVGSGNVAHHLAQAILSLESNAFVLKQIVARNKSNWTIHHSQLQVADQWENLSPTDWVFICVKDEAIHEVSKQIPWKNALLLHTSGSTSVDVISAEQRGVWYPLQTFSKSTPVKWKEIPIALEVNDSGNLAKLLELANLLSDHVAVLSYEQRLRLHLAAVFSCNFVNHLYHISDQLLQKEQLSFEWLLPLIKATTEKLQYVSPKEAQTGPAVRNDSNTINKQLAQLPEKEREIYQLLTNSIQQYHLKNE